MLKKTITIMFAVVTLIMAGYFLFSSYPDFKVVPLTVEKKDPIKVTIEMWGLWDNSDTWNEIISRFEKKNYNFEGKKIDLSINYTKKDYGTYEKELLNAEQKNRKPNIFMINNIWLEKYADDLEPLDDNMALAEEYNLIRYEDVVDIFPSGLIIGLVNNDRLYGLPMYSDSLVLYYNKDLFEDAGIKDAPQTWNDFKLAVKKLTSIDARNDIIKSGVAIGSGKNINRSSDILALLMMQGGANVIDSNRNVDINSEIEVKTEDGIENRTPGKTAIMFYAEFTNPKKAIYSWNKKQENSVKAFSNKETAMMFGYSYQIKNLLALNPDLNYGISKMPQLENSTVVNFSNVWTPVVSKNNNCKIWPEELSETIDCGKIAWSFLSFVAEKENAKMYLESTGKAAARKDLISEQINSESKMSVFASQAKSAVSYNKFDDRIDGILENMIDEINLDRGSWEEKVDEAVGEIEKLK